MSLFETAMSEDGADQWGRRDSQREVLFVCVLIWLLCFGNHGATRTGCQVCKGKPEEKFREILSLLKTCPDASPFVSPHQLNVVLT
jgi:hypothetical protein